MKKEAVMAKGDNIASITTQVFALLEKLKSEDRVKVVTATLTLLGENVRQQGSAGSPESEEGDGTEGLDNEKAFFNKKDPKGKMEELAVAARYRELKLNEHEHGKSDFQAVIGEARRNFDSNNFMRDLENAKNRGFFTRSRNIKLSYHGQQYVDALPDREAIKQLRKPRLKKKSAKKKKKKKG